jgi:hypothetical protein
MGNSKNGAFLSGRRLIDEVRAQGLCFASNRYGFSYCFWALR